MELTKFDLQLIINDMQIAVDDANKHNDDYNIKRFGKKRKPSYNSGLGRRITALNNLKLTLQSMESN